MTGGVAPAYSVPTTDVKLDGSKAQGHDSGDGAALLGLESPPVHDLLALGQQENQLGAARHQGDRLLVLPQPTDVGCEGTHGRPTRRCP